MEKIIFVKPREFTSEMIEKLETKCVIVIECKNPDKVKFYQTKTSHLFGQTNYSCPF